MSESGYDAVIIGGGIIGCSIGWRLAQSGRRVAVVERGLIGGEASSAAAGVLMPIAGPDPTDRLLSFYLTSLGMFGAFVDEVRDVTGHAFEYRVSGRLEVALTDDEVAQLRQSFAYQEPAGVRSRWLSGAEARSIEPMLTPEAQAAIFYLDHGYVDNPRLTRALAAAVRRAGGDVFENRLVTGLAIEGDRVVGVATSLGHLSAPLVVNAAGAWSGLVDVRAPAPVRPSKGEILAVDPGPHPLRTQVGGFGGSAFSRATGLTLISATRYDAGYDKDVVVGAIFGLYQRTLRLLPGLAEARFREVWAGLRPACPDSQPIIGRDPDLGGLVWATGHFGMGILCAPATARAVVELIDAGASSLSLAPFGVERFRRPATPSLVLA